jgi:hypothetical protein
MTLKEVRSQAAMRGFLSHEATHNTFSSLLNTQLSPDVPATGILKKRARSGDVA